MASSIIGIYCVDVCLMYYGCATDLLHPDPELNQQEFYSVIVEELIDKNIK